MKFKKAFIYRAVPRHSHVSPGDEHEMRDMMRYDRAFINPSFPGLVLFARLVTKGGGCYSETPTVGRWESEGFTIENVDLRHNEDENINFLDVDAQPGKWFTFRRIGREYIKATLSEVLKHDTFQDLDEALKELEKRKKLNIS